MFDMDHERLFVCFFLAATLMLRTTCSTGSKQFFNKKEFATNNEIITKARHKRYTLYMMAILGRIFAGVKRKAVHKTDDLCEDYNCVSGYCVTNCGFTFGRAKWCYMTREQTWVKRILHPYVECEHMNDCTECLPCAGSCAEGMELPERYY